MPDDNKTNYNMAMDGFRKVQPLNEGYLAKGGINSTSKITERPPAPAILTPTPPPTSAPAPVTVSNKPKA